MTFDQAAILLLLLALLGVFALDRFRIELVALCGLAVAFVLGLVPPDQIFSGFASSAVLTVIELLIITRVIARSQLVDRIAARMTSVATGERAILAMLTGVAAFVSVFMNNIGALALVLPVAHSLSRMSGVPLGRMLIPLSFATLLGGVCSVIGTPANLVVSAARAGAGLEPFALFDLAWVGLPVAIAGIVWLVGTGPHLLAGRGITTTKPVITGPRRLVAEVTVPDDSPLIGKRLDAVDSEVGGRVHSMLRGGRHLFTRREDRRIAAGDLLLLEADAHSIMELGTSGALNLAQAPLDIEPSDFMWTEAVVLPQSTIVGSAIAALDDFHANGISIVAVAPQRHRFEGRLADVQLSIGDVLLLRGRSDAMKQVLHECDCLALSPRGIEPPQPGGMVAAFLFIVGIALAATSAVPPHIAFGAVVGLLALLGVFELRRAIASVDWSIVVMLAATIPLGDAIDSTGAASLIARALVVTLGSADPLTLAVTMLFLAVAVTPFVNNASTAIVLAPIAVGIARDTGVDPSPLLIAVALGASLDFLTPFGHQNNLLVMGLGGYRFRDFARVGVGLTVICIAVGLIGIGWRWT